jgi:hypothetical protein
MMRVMAICSLRGFDRNGFIDTNHEYGFQISACVAWLASSSLWQRHTGRSDDGSRRPGDQKKCNNEKNRQQRPTADKSKPASARPAAEDTQEHREQQENDPQGDRDHTRSTPPSEWLAIAPGTKVLTNPTTATARERSDNPPRRRSFCETASDPFSITGDPAAT